MANEKIMAFTDTPLINLFDDGRLQLRHGPIDLIIEALGPQDEVERALQQAAAAFNSVLPELVNELDMLRMQTGTHDHCFKGSIAANMNKVASGFSVDHFVSPMIAVAGAVADHVLNEMIVGRQLTKAYVNNGGDIALHLDEQAYFDIGICANPVSGSIVSKAKVTKQSNIRGVATSGWRGRSHSLGIADAVTVLAESAAAADAAATLIANAVDLPGHPLIRREVASMLSPDSDLGEQLVTVGVGELSEEESRSALRAGQRLARAMIDSGRVIAVYGNLNSQVFAQHEVQSGRSNSIADVSTDHIEKELACA